MPDFKRKTAVMPEFPPTPSTTSLAEELDEVGDLQCRTLARLLEQSDSLDQKTTWACNEIVQLNHVQGQLITANNNHAEKIDAIERRELSYKSAIGAYIKTTAIFVSGLSAIIAGIIGFGVTWFFNQQKEQNARPGNPVELARPTH
jgi:hypothetical protein